MDRDEAIELARAVYADGDINIDDDAEISEAEDGSGCWVSAWVWVSASEATSEPEYYPDDSAPSAKECDYAARAWAGDRLRDPKE